MDWNKQTLEFLSQSLLDTLSAQPELRRRADQENLSDDADTPNYGLLAVLVAEPSVDELTRQCAAIIFKNHLKTRWVPLPPIPDSEKQQIKTLILPLMLSVTGKIQAQIIEALAVIGNHDFPEFWPDLKSSLETSMNSNDFASVKGIFATINSLFENTNIHHELFPCDEIFQHIVIPIVMLRDEDEELFDNDEFITRDMEGNTRRRIACDLLLKGSTNTKQKIREQIHKWLTVFEENPDANWKYKECAIYLVLFLATGNGASISTDDVVDVENFFKSVIVPELQQQDVNTFPMLKASALKFFTVFRFLIPKHVAVPLLSDLVRFVDSYRYVVHSYAAICIEKLLLVKDNNNNNNPRYTSADIHPIHEDLIRNFFGALNITSICIQHCYNHYIMRCMMRVVEIADDISVTCLSNCFDGLTMALSSIMNCTDVEDAPEYYHFLFETVARVVRKASETGHLTRFQREIRDQVTSTWARSFAYPQLFPYFLQLLALLDDISVTYTKFVMSIIDGICWNPVFERYRERPANLSILVRLLQSSLQDAPPDEVVNKNGRLRRVLDRTINKLMSSPTTEELGFRLLNTVIENYEYDAIAEYMNQIWALLFTRLQNTTTLTPRLVRCVIVFMSLFLVKHGVQTLVDLTNSISVDVNLFHDVILGEFWILNLKNIGSGYGYTEVKVIAVASTKLLCESALLLDPAAEEVWGKLLDAIVTLLTQRVLEEERERVDDEEPDLTGYHFRNAVGFLKQEEDWDPLKEIKDPKHFLVTFPEKIFDEFRGKFPLVFMRHLSPPNQAALVELCTSYKIDIV